MEKGYNVLCEKPMALNSEDCEAMLAAEKKSGKHFMIAQVLRFFDEYEYLRTCIENNTFGKPLSAFFNRVSNPPIWGWENWFMDYSKSGGCITDLHIHDVDIVRYLFGEPKSVSCHAVDTCTKYDLVQTVFQYDDVLVTAHGAWAAKQTKFAANYRVEFEKASVVYENGKVTVYPNDDTAPYSPELGSWSGYTNEISYFCDVVSGTIENKRNPASSAAKTICLIEAMKKSADQKK
jgi:predicted dehydrogenase